MPGSQIVRTGVAKTRSAGLDLEKGAVVEKE